MNATAKTVLGVLGVTLPALFSYLSARAESSEAKVRAEVAYITLQASVVELQKRVEEQDDLLAKQQGQLELMQRWHPGPMPPPSEHTVRAKMPAPPEKFLDAVEQYRVKK